MNEVWTSESPDMVVGHCCDGQKLTVRDLSTLKDCNWLNSQVCALNQLNIHIVMYSKVSLLSGCQFIHAKHCNGIEQSSIVSKLIKNELG